MLRYGNICDVDAAKGLVRVEFDDDGITSAWIPVTTHGTSGNKYAYTFDVGEHVACLMDEHAENGVVIGAIYSQANTPTGGNKDKVSVNFSDGASVAYNRATHTLEVKVGGTELKLTQSGGFTVKKGGETLKALLTDILTQLQAETHISSGPGSPTSVPVNAAAYAAISARVALFFES